MVSGQNNFNKNVIPVQKHIILKMSMYELAQLRPAELNFCLKCWLTKQRNNESTYIVFDIWLAPCPEQDPT